MVTSSRTWPTARQSSRRARLRSPTRSRRTRTGATASQSRRQDVIFTLTTIMNPKNDVAGRAGYDDISRVKAIELQDVKLTFRSRTRRGSALRRAVRRSPEARPPGQGLQRDLEHEREQPDHRQADRQRSLHPRDYTKGQSMTMVRNPKFYGPRPKIDKIVFRFITNTDSEIQAIKGGEVDAIYPQPQLQLGDLRRTSRAQGPLERRCDVRAHRLQRRQEGLRAGEGSVVPAGVRIFDRPHCTREAALPAR